MFGEKGVLSTSSKLFYPSIGSVFPERPDKIPGLTLLGVFSRMVSESGFYLGAGV